MKRTKRPVFWKRMRGSAKAFFDRYLPMERRTFTLHVWFEPGTYEHLEIDHINAQIAKSIATASGIRHFTQIKTQLVDESTGCKTGIAQVRD